MHLLVTRPQPDAEDLQRKLEIKGFRITVAPLLDIRMGAQRSIPSRSYQAVVITSANGARALAQHPARHRLAGKVAYAVGPQSRAAAAAAGFEKVVEADGDVNAVIRKLESQLEPRHGPILYLSGEETSGDVEAVLQRRGFEVDRVIMYAAVPATHLAPPVTAMIRRRAIDGVLLYSRRTAKVWRKCILADGLEPHAGQMMHFCLAAAVAGALPESWPVKIAANANEQGMFELIEQWRGEKAERQTHGQ
jgi:uroporphyrinogen-III synthase